MLVHGATFCSFLEFKIAVRAPRALLMLLAPFFRVTLCTAYIYYVLTIFCLFAGLE